jgi:hypothetical protein
VTLVPQNSGYPVVVDSNSVYYASIGGTSWNDPQAVMKVPLLGGTPTILASGQTIIDGMAVDATSVYWTNPGAIMKVPLLGGSTTMVASGGQIYSQGDVAVDGTSVYWTAYDTSNNQSVFKAPLALGLSTILATGSSFAIDATSVYYTAGSTVAMMTKTGGSPTTLATGESNPSTIVVDAIGIHWSAVVFSSQTWSVRSLPFGGTPTTLATGSALGGGIRSLASDGTSIYWTVDGTPGSVMRVPCTGGAAVALASGLHPSHIVVDATSIYWSNYSGATMKLTPK